MKPRLLVFTDQRWDEGAGLAQLLARLAAQRHVTVVEEPVYGISGSFLQRFTPRPNLEVLRPHTPVAAPGFCDEQLPELKTLLSDHLTVGTASPQFIAWLATPAGLPLLEQLEPIAIVYQQPDDMPLDVPAALFEQRERDAMQRADLVLTRGPAAREALSRLHPNVHCLPVSVAALRPPEGCAGWPASDAPAADRPTLGFAGVVDSRIDLSLLCALADAEPQWQLVIVGPHADVEPLPHRPNLHWVGQGSAQLLPRIAASWDVCLLPLRREVASQRASGSGRALDLLVSGKPVVATVAPDLPSPWLDLVDVAADADAIVAVCRRHLAASAAQRAQRAQALSERCAGSTPEAAAGAVLRLLEPLSTPRRTPSRSDARAGGDRGSAPVLSLRARSGATGSAAARRVANVIIGAGPTGLSAAYYLDDPDTLLIEREHRVGGRWRSRCAGGFTFDYPGHAMAASDPEVAALYQRLLGENLHWQLRTASIWADGRFMPYRSNDPFAAAVGHSGVRFGYPMRGGYQALMDALLGRLRGEVALDTRALRVSPLDRTVLLDDGRVVRYDTLISTIPLPQLVEACGDEAPAEVRRSAESLRYMSLRCVHLGIARERLTDLHWIYFAGDTVFHRVFAQGNASPHCSPPGGFGLTCEVIHSPARPLVAHGDALVDRCVADCVRVGLLREDDRVLAACEVDLRYAYVVYDHARSAGVEQIRGWLGRHGVVLAGLYSEWEYCNSEHPFLAGRKAAQQALVQRSGAPAAQVR
ncbi:MAG TPA: FAD-dependent oxidoreductase [Burkholderiaceae bacterium]|nr:FAD-dependent oxidoreductase [Burkholderiaceae bacterium]